MNDIPLQILWRLMDMKMSASSKDTIRKHWNPTAVFTGIWHPKRGKEVSESKLLPGELSAATFRVGCYTVRSAQRLYKVCDHGDCPEGETPADQAEVELVKKDMISIEGMDKGIGFDFAGFGFYSWEDKLRMTHEVSARHNASPNDGFTCICRVEQPARFCPSSEVIGTICTAKEHIFSPDRNACLFVCNTYMGDSFSAETWYKLDPARKITTLRLHPYDSEQEKARFQ